MWQIKRIKMNWQAFCAVVLCVLTASPVGSQVLPEQTFSPDQTPGYKPVRPALKALAATQPGKARAQHFCVIGYLANRITNEASTSIAWVHWKEQNSLIYWESAVQGTQPKDTLIHSRRQLDLAQDVVATQTEVVSSSYLVSRDWVNSVLEDCKKRGVTYSVKNK
jgi:hypothetical protein